MAAHHGCDSEVSTYFGHIVIGPFDHSVEKTSFLVMESVLEIVFLLVAGRLSQEEELSSSGEWWSGGGAQRKM